jgi:hypothetical protein
MNDRERAAMIAEKIGAMLEREKLSAVVEAEALTHALIISIRLSRRDPIAKELLLSSVAGMWDEYAGERPPERLS